MRPIDADALREEICSWGMNDYEPSDFIDAIDEAPTVETTIENLIITLSVEELKATTFFKVDTPSGEAISFRREKTGHWIKTKFLKLRECSCCHVRWGMYDVENFCFCPNCGAEMRKEATND